MIKAAGAYAWLLEAALVFLVWTSAQGSSFAAVAEPPSQPLMERFSLRTNALEWMLTVPNIQLGFDLFPGPYNRSSVLAGIKYNWDTWHRSPAYYVFDVFDIRAEYRHHFRRAPRTWVANYIGGYADFSTFSLKFSPTGRQGSQAGIGVSAGIEIPLYGYRTGAVDLELGASAGVSYSHFMYYTLSSSNTAYVPSGGPRVMVIPVVSELRATLSWRKTSVKEKYIKTDPDIPIVNAKLEDIRKSFALTSKQTFDDYVGSLPKAERKAIAQSDSLYRARFLQWLGEDTDYTLGQIEEMTVAEKRKETLRKEVRKLTAGIVADFDRQMALKEKEARDKERIKAREEKARAKAAKKQKAEEGAGE